MKGIRLSLALGATILGVLALGSAAASADGISLAAIDVMYTQNFDSLVATGTTPSDALPVGWAISETGTGAAADGKYVPGAGSGTGGNTYSFGTGASSERALGTLLSGSVAPMIGAGFVNATPRTISSLDIAYTGEEWRANNVAPDRLDFQVSTDATSLTTGTWTDVDALDLVSPVTGTAGALDGNAAANRTAIAGTVAGLAVAPGGQVWIRWRDFDVAPGSDDGLAVDDFSLTPRSVSNLPVTVACGSSVSMTHGFAAAKTVTASDGDGLVTSLDIAGVSPSPSAGSIARTAFTPAGAVGGSASATVSMSADLAVGTYTVTMAAANDDVTPQAGSCSFTVVVDPVLRVGDVQGPGDASPYDHETVAVRGVVTQTLLTSDSSHAFFLQSTAATSDDDPLTSDGIYVYEGYYGDLRKDGGYYVPKVGDELILRGPAQEYYGQTELNNPYVLQIVSSGVAAVPAPIVADPPDELADANGYWERHEGMLMQVPAQSVALSGRDVFSPADAEIWFARSDSAIAQRNDPYTRRAFRDAHPLDGLFDGNGYRILIGSFGVKAAADDPSLLLTPVRAFDTLQNAPAGGLYFDYGKYSIEAIEQLEVTAGVDPSLNASPKSFVREKEYSLATFNVENLYDYRDDPNDGCDFTGNSGCPGVKPPFDYVPASEQAYQTRLHQIAQQIAGAMHAPDLILVQEAEDQDICSVAGGALQCGTADNADGKPDTLQDLALAVAAEGGPAYDAAFDRDGADDRGIVSGFLYRTDRVQLLPVSAEDPVLGSSPQVVYRGAPLASNADVQNPKTLNAVLPGDVDRRTGVDGANVFTRAPEVGHFRIWRVRVGDGTFVDLWAISNHFSSGPDTRVGQRTEQAAYDAAIVAALQVADPEAKIVLGGDLNVYPEPDDPFPAARSHQLGPLYEQGLQNLWDTIAAQVPSAAYSYVFQGQAQTLDQLFVTQSLFGDLVQGRYAHVNSDWPKDEAGDGPYGTSDHDPLVARFRHVPTHAGGTLR